MDTTFRVFSATFVRRHGAGPFGFTVSAQTLPSLDGGSAPPNETDPEGGLVVDPASPGQDFPPFFDSTITFYIDDIEFQ
jgi:hypothetical protein